MVVWVERSSERVVSGEARGQENKSWGKIGGTFTKSPFSKNTCSCSWKEGEMGEGGRKELDYC